MIKVENKMTFFFKDTEKDFLVTQEDENNFQILTFVGLVKKILILWKLETTVTWLERIEVQHMKNVM